MRQALYLNGVYEDVLEEIVNAQSTNPALVCFLQPYNNRRIKLLAENPSTQDSPIQLYISTTDSLGVVSYLGEIVGWENKHHLWDNAARLKQLNKHMKKYQPNENEIYLRNHNGRLCLNLIHIRYLMRLAFPMPVTSLVKASDNTNVKVKTRSGGFAYVYELPKWVGREQIVVKDQLDNEYESAIEAALNVDKTERKKRLNIANKQPERIQILSVGYRRNPDVVAEVLKRANGKCEACRQDAPFLRATDGTPYLEIHHWIPLAEGGDDTIENAGAVCPNCHRKFHFGIVE